MLYEGRKINFHTGEELMQKRRRRRRRKRKRKRKRRKKKNQHQERKREMEGWKKFLFSAGEEWRKILVS